VRDGTAEHPRESQRGRRQSNADQVPICPSACEDLGMKQQTLALAADQNAQYEQYRRPTKRDTFLATMEQIVPWADLCAVIEPHYPKAGNGRPPLSHAHLFAAGHDKRDARRWCRAG
jgi:hypothetical protein